MAMRAFGLFRICQILYIITILLHSNIAYVIVQLCCYKIAET